MIVKPEITAYRPCVGVMLINDKGLVWLGRRFEKQNDDGIGKWWQMPQGGIDEGEDAAKAALRELQEETAVTSAHVIAEAPGWYKYDLPDHLIGKSWGGKYRGQKQKWFAMKFDGPDSEINLKPPGHKQEFDEWRWAKMDEMLDIIIPFKRAVYVDVIAAFRHLGA
ncbi:MAG: RNA pyrophosphohydrolase [Alphaproteobacteria bacterium]|nr:RNA pyrophosphohydrolase [Alphaproteobacteria bacterium]